VAIHRRRKKENFISNFIINFKKNDISNCIYNTEIFDFLIDIIPKEEIK